MQWFLHLVAALQNTSKDDEDINCYHVLSIIFWHYAEHFIGIIW